MKSIKSIFNIWFFYTILILVEFVLFKRYISINITNFYPVNMDQTSFLPMSYSIYENIKTYGLWSGILKSKQLATGIWFPIQAALFYCVFGVSRLSALLPNFIYFALLQYFILLTGKSICRSNAFSLIILAMLLVIQSPFVSTGGGIADFRLDFIAFCLYGIVLCSIIKSNFFLHTKWVMITTFFCILLILSRCITFVYLLGFLVSMALYLFARITWLNKVSIFDKLSMLRRLKHIIYCVFLIAGVGVAYIAFNKEDLFGYYFVGHISGNEKFIRAVEAGVTNLVEAFTFYLKSLFVIHLGKLFIIVSSLAAVFYYLDSLMSKNRRGIMQTNNLYENSLVQWDIGLVFILSSLVIPYLVLTSDVSKSPVVGSILVVPAIWLLAWVYLFFAKRKIDTSFSLNLLAVVLILIGVGHQAKQMLHHKSKTQIRELSQITQMYQDIGDYAVKNHLEKVHLSLDHISDYLSSGGIASLYYELHGKLLSIEVQKLGGTIFAINENDAIKSLQQSHVLILNLTGYRDASPYPFNESARQLHGRLKQYAEQNFTKLGDYQFKDGNYRVYIR